VTPLVLSQTLSTPNSWDSFLASLTDDKTLGPRACVPLMRKECCLSQMAGTCLTLEPLRQASSTTNKHYN
jgi:hypothetical protein